MRRALHVHVENDPTSPVSLQVHVSDLLARLAGIEEITVTLNAEPSRRAEALRGADVLIAACKLDIAAAKAASPGLAWVQTISAGVEAFLPTLPPGVVLTNASGVHAEKGAEFVLTACLMLTFGIPRFVDDKAARRWAPSYGGTIHGRTVVLLGVGSIGAAAAAMLRRQGARVVGVTRSGRADAALDACYSVDRLDAVLPEADILAITVPATPQTRGLIDADRLALLKPGAGLVNVGRGAVVDHAALLAAMREGRLGGAVLDVFPVEPLPPDDPSWSCPGLVFTPHCSLDDHGTYIARCLDIFGNNLRRFRAGEPLLNRVDPAAGY